MPLQPDRLRYLLHQYFMDQITREELEELYAAIPSEKTEDMEALLDETFEEMEVDGRAQEVNWDQLFQRIVDPKPVAPRRTVFSWSYAAAAALLLLAGAGLMYLSLHKTISPRPVADAGIQSKHDVLPGANKAVLTLGDGSVVSLDSAGNQVLRQGRAAIHQQGGMLQYRTENGDAPITYNTLTTPRGGQFQVKLPDGTEVWLNAASSLKYPTAFTGNQRTVTLTGEAYFEVVHNDKMPFRVQVHGLEIKDLGTHFNIMAYEDECDIKTTLVEGAVQVNSAHREAALQPGQEAVLSRKGEEHITVRPADVETAIAWKNGEFAFHHTSLHEIMRQVSRWYDVDIEYKDDLNIYLSGNIRKNVNVSEVFKMLELAGDVHFSVDNKKATVMK